MKVQCPSCREIIEMERFSTSDDGLRFACPDCGEENFLPNFAKVACGAGTKAREARTKAREEGANEERNDRLVTERVEGARASGIMRDAPIPKRTVEATDSKRDEDEMVCPKCGHAQTDNEACHVCGLSFDLFDPAKMDPDPAEAKALWKQVLEAPEDLPVHDRFVEACYKADRLDYAHRQYRIFERETGMIEVAETMRYRIQELARLQLGSFDLTPKGDDGGAARRRKVLWGIVAIIGLLWIAYVVMDSLSAFKS